MHFLRKGDKIVSLRRCHGKVYSINPKDQFGTLGVTLEEKILMAILKNPKATQSQIEDMVESSERSVKRAIKNLVEWKMLERKGGKRYGHWEINENINVDKGKFKL